LLFQPGKIEWVGRLTVVVNRASSVGEFSAPVEKGQDMRCIGVAIVAAAMAFGVAVMAQTSTGPSAAGTAGPPRMERVAGKLTKIDGKALTITAEGKETVVNCTDTTRIGKRPQPAAEGATAPTRGRGRGIQAKFEDLEVGQELMAVYNPEGNVARMVMITSAAAAPGSPASGGGAAETTK